MTEEFITVILKILDKEVKVMKLKEIQSTITIPFADSFEPATFLEEDKVPDNTMVNLHYLQFEFTGEARRCECGRHTMPIFKLTGIT